MRAVAVRAPRMLWRFFKLELWVGQTEIVTISFLGSFLRFDVSVGQCAPLLELSFQEASVQRSTDGLTLAPEFWSIQESRHAALFWHRPTVFLIEPIQKLRNLVTRDIRNRR